MGRIEHEEPKHEIIGLRLSNPLKRMLEEAIEKDMHLTIQELIRSAIRNYMEQKYPQLFERYKQGIQRERPRAKIQRDEVK